MVYTYKGVLFSPEKEGHSIIWTTWMDLEDIILNEISVIKGQYWMISPVQSIQNKIIEIKGRMVVARGWMEGQ